MNPFSIYHWKQKQRRRAMVLLTRCYAREWVFIGQEGREAMGKALELTR